MGAEAPMSLSRRHRQSVRDESTIEVHTQCILRRPDLSERPTGDCNAAAGEHLARKSFVNQNKTRTATNGKSVPIPRSQRAVDYVEM